uniref:C-type lectin domain-containing protein n=1 Tax=Salvator merianae TaxID=96440 RepID=A0A8D0KKJ2_SALMN
EASIHTIHIKNFIYSFSCIYNLLGYCLTYIKFLPLLLVSKATVKPFMLSFFFIFFFCPLLVFPCGSRSREWEYFDGRCYFFSIQRTNWLKAKAKCQSWNSQLVVIQDAAKQNFIQSRTRNEHYWIGLTDMDNEGEWRWIDGTNYLNGFTNWHKGEPNDSEGKEDCVQMHNDGEWNDLPCNNENNFYICEKPLPS